MTVEQDAQTALEFVIELLPNDKEHAFCTDCMDQYCALVAKVRDDDAVDPMLHKLLDAVSERSGAFDLDARETWDRMHRVYRHRKMFRKGVATFRSIQKELSDSRYDP